MARVAALLEDSGLRRDLLPTLKGKGLEVIDQRILCSEFKSIAADLLIVEWSSQPGHPGLAWVRRASQELCPIPIVVIAVQSSEALAIEALRLGMRDYLKYPLEVEDVLAAVHRWIGTGRSKSGSQERTGIVGDSSAMEAVRAAIRKVAPNESAVLITGDTGTGKELVAHEIHRASPRRDKPFICVNCAAIPDTLFESEFFGYERGAFTGAVCARDGKFKQADGGTVFLDEIGDMSSIAQAKILRAIESKDICPLGGYRSLKADVRIITATNRNLDAMAEDEKFRKDLLFRLKIAHIDIPPLREHPSDIPVLVKHFLPHFNKMFRCQVEGCSEEAMQILLEYTWPGNVRELKNVLEMIFLNLPTGRISRHDLPEHILEAGRQSYPAGERERLVAALLSTHWNVSETARKLNWSRMTVYRKLAKHGILRLPPCNKRELTVTDV